MTADTRQRTDHTCTRRFSEGIEHLPDTREKQLTGRFSCGIERSPNSPEKTVTRRFSHGIEQLPDTPDSVRSAASAVASSTTSSGHDRTSPRSGLEHHVQRAR